MNESDKKWIENAIRHHDRRFPTGPDSIALSVVTAKKEQEELEFHRKITSTGVIRSSDSGRRLGVTMPENLYIVLRKKYPTLFTDKDNYRWFKRKFPMFVAHR